MAPRNNHDTRTVFEPIAVVIPAYNEAERVSNVLQAAIGVPHLTQIIVVDDGSQDDTVDVVTGWQGRDSRIELISLRVNHGKAGAIAVGAEHAGGDIVAFIDADLSGLQPHHIQQLTAPVRRRECAMTLGLFQNGRRSTDVTHRYLPFLSGQRCLRWSLFRDAVGLPNVGWSLETALNLHAWYNGYPTWRVPWQGVTHAMRPEKQPGLGGYTSHITMWSQIMRYTLHFIGDTGVASVLARLQDDQPPPSTVPLNRYSHRNNHSDLMRRPLL